MRITYRLTLVVGMILFLYLGWVFYLRGSRNRAFVERLAEPARMREKAIVDAYGGRQLTILAFYAVPAEIGRGAVVKLCYGVSNAQSVRIEPTVEDVWPSFSRCVDVKPVRDTVYTLIAEDAAGNRKTATVSVSVRY